MIEIINVGKAFGKYISSEHPKPISRQQQKMKELGVVTTVCLNKQHGKTPNSFYKCLRDEADSHTKN